VRFGSVCSGIEAASVAWGPLGWKAAWVSEIEPFPSAVLKHHYPDVPNLGDMTTLPARIASGEVEAPDLFCGGTPCQAFSVAGLRKSLDDARGNLSLTFCEISDAIDNVRLARGEPASIVFWENVPGVLSTKDNAFGCFLGALSGSDTSIVPSGRWTDAGVVAGPKRTVAWRTLDAQYFGVAQRRRRVFVVASARDDFDPAAVLLEWEGLRRDSAPSREAGKAVARSAAFSAGNSSNARSVGYIEEGTPPLRAGASGTNQVPTCITVAQCLTTGTGQRYDPETKTLLPCVFPTLEANDGKKWGSNQWVNQGKAIVQPVVGFDSYNHAVTGDVSKTLDVGQDYHHVPNVFQPVAFQETADCLTAAYGTKWNGNASATNGSLFAAQPVAFHPTQDPISSTDGTTHAMGCGSKTGQASVAVAFTARDYGNDATTELAPTMRSLSKGADGHQSGSAGLAVAIGWDEELNASEEQSGTLLRGGQGGRHDGVMQPNMQVRRLTPVECERLQGFPDNYTEIPWRKKPISECPDGPRYKALGNSWAVPVVRWIGKRIQERLNAP